MYEQAAQYDKYKLVAGIDVRIGGKEIIIHDEVTNCSQERISPLELLYHINIGPPAVSKSSRMIFKGDVQPRDKNAAQGLKQHAAFSDKRKGFVEECYFINLASSPDGQTGTMVVNPLENIAVYEIHNKNQLKCFTQWKQMGTDEYVNGLEPGTSLPNCRGEERKAGRLEFLKPGECRSFDITIGVLGDHSEINKAIQLLESDRLSNPLNLQ